MILHIPHDTSGGRTFRCMSTCTRSCQVTLARTSSPFTTRCIAPMTSADCSCTCLTPHTASGECWRVLASAGAPPRDDVSNPCNHHLSSEVNRFSQPGSTMIHPSRHPAIPPPSKCSKKLTCSLISSKPHPAKILAWMACQRKLML